MWKIAKQKVMNSLGFFPAFVEMGILQKIESPPH